MASCDKLLFSDMLGPWLLDILEEVDLCARWDIISNIYKNHDCLYQLRAVTPVMF